MAALLHPPWALARRQSVSLEFQVLGPTEYVQSRSPRPFSHLPLPKASMIGPRLRLEGVLVELGAAPADGTMDRPR